MAFMFDIVYDASTGRHRMEFINQQFDYLMEIRFDETTGTYQLNVPLEEANKINQYWGKQDFDLEFWLANAKEKLMKADQELRDKKG